MSENELATQQNLITLFEVARGHHQQLTSFSILIILGAIGFAVTDTFRHVSPTSKLTLAVAIILAEIVIGMSLYNNANFQNDILSEAKKMNQVASGAPDIKALLSKIGDTPSGLLASGHIAMGLLVGAFMVFGIANAQNLKVDKPGFEVGGAAV